MRINLYSFKVAIFWDVIMCVREVFYLKMLYCFNERQNKYGYDAVIEYN